MITKYKDCKKVLFGNIDEELEECSLHVLVPEHPHPEYPNMLGYLVFQYKAMLLNISCARLIVINDNPDGMFYADEYATDDAYRYIAAYTIGSEMIPKVELFWGPFVDFMISTLKIHKGNDFTSREFYTDMMMFIMDSVDRDYDVTKMVDTIMEDDLLINFVKTFVKTDGTEDI